MLINNDEIFESIGSSPRMLNKEGYILPLVGIALMKMNIYLAFPYSTLIPRIITSGN